MTALKKTSYFKQYIHINAQGVKLVFCPLFVLNRALQKQFLLKLIFKFYCMTNNLVEEFNNYRTRMNEVILGNNNLVMKRLWNLDTNTYEEGAINTKTKEMLGLVASMVLRCDDCIKYHLGKCHELGVNTKELYEIFAVANIVGGTIVVPHTRRAAEYWEALQTT